MEVLPAILLCLDARVKKGRDGAGLATGTGAGNKNGKNFPTREGAKALGDAHRQYFPGPENEV